jgi:hypothetical protein
MLHDQPDCLFRQTPAQLRQIGARGGRACARNRRARVRAATAPPPQAVPPVAPLPETAAEAIATLDLQFPWLRGAEHCLCPGPQYGSLSQAPHSPTRPRVVPRQISPQHSASPAPELQLTRRTGAPVAPPPASAKKGASQKKGAP